MPDDVQQGIQYQHWLENTELALAQLQRLQAQGKSLLPTQSINQAQMDDLVAFLAALTDPCTQDPSCMNKWVPSNEEDDPDGLRLVAYDQEGNLL